jgi:hypothetical protein
MTICANNRYISKTRKGEAIQKLTTIINDGKTALDYNAIGKVIFDEAIRKSD